MLRRDVIKRMTLLVPGVLATACTQTELLSVSVEEVFTTAQRSHSVLVGPAAARLTVYVFFDPQCVHCARLWEASRTLIGPELNMRWIPVAVVGKASKNQVVKILESDEPDQTLSSMEGQTLLGMASAAIQEANPAGRGYAMAKQNTDLWYGLGVPGVPYLVWQDRNTGQIRGHKGALDTTSLRSILGI